MTPYITQEWLHFLIRVGDRGSPLHMLSFFSDFLKYFVVVKEFWSIFIISEMLDFCFNFSFIIRFLSIDAITYFLKISLAFLVFSLPTFPISSSMDIPLLDSSIIFCIINFHLGCLKLLLLLLLLLFTPLEFFTGVWVTASLLSSSGLFSVFWPFSIILSFGWSPLVRQLPSLQVFLITL